MSENDEPEITQRPTRSKKDSKQKPKQYVSPDGRARNPKTEHNINECFAIVFRGAAGDEVRKYLRSISVNAVSAPGTDPNVIIQMEGARWLMGVIDSRIKDGEEKRP